jgi:hypothetical protein
MEPIVTNMMEKWRESLWIWNERSVKTVAKTEIM